MVFYPHNGIQLGNKKERTIDIQHELISKSQHELISKKHYVKQKKPDTKVYILNDSIYVNI